MRTMEPIRSARIVVIRLVKAAPPIIRVDHATVPTPILATNTVNKSPNGTK
uniref:Uncharacterized protein n=1 Tax=Moniliophthora roreri TaxID=221103 RepID=A0A0W0FTT7_MONRR